MLGIEKKIYGGGIKHIIPVNLSEHQVLNKYIILLRKLECYTNSNNKFLKLYYMLRLRRLQIRTGILIPPNTCGEGLSLSHLGSIVINERARIGNNCRIHIDTVVGAISDGAPSIGNNVYYRTWSKDF